MKPSLYNSIMKQVWKPLKTIGTIYCLLLVCFTLLIYIVCLIPHGKIEANCRASVVGLYEQGLYPKVVPLPLCMLDTYTDATMLNIAYCADESSPLTSAMLNYFYADATYDMLGDTYELVCGNSPERCFFESYARYWHGYQVVLRPLLAVMNYGQIIRLNVLIFVVLMLWCLYLAWTRISPSAAFCMLTACLLTGVFVVPLCLQFSTCFMLAFLSTVLVLQFPALTGSSYSRLATFMVIGGVTSYLDFLTTPQLTLVFPMVCSLLAAPTRQPIRSITICATAWAAGYASLWLSKCMVAWLLTGHNVLADFMTSLAARSTAGLGDIAESTAELAARGYVVIGFLLTIVLLSAAILWLLALRRGRREHAWLLLTALVVPCWYVLAMQHSIVHYWFTWRASAASLFCILLFLCIPKSRVR